jgi:S1-C subfamily serine protease
MSKESEYRISSELQPRDSDVSYDLGQALSAVVSLRARIPDDAFTAGVLGTDRTGHGVLIDASGLIVTIGYVVTEADDIWVVTNDGKAVPGHLVGYDYESGFGLVQALGRLSVPIMPLGDSARVTVGGQLILAGYGGRTQALKTQVVARHEFAGYWEYVLEDALFTAPPHPNWGGAALIGADGRLVGIGSLYINDIVPSIPDIEGNLSVPIDLLKPIMDELQRFGRTLKPARPWLGMFATEAEGGLIVAGTYDAAPAAQAGLRAGDVITEVAGSHPESLASLFRAVWAVGTAGCTVPLRVERDGKTKSINVASVDRRDFWKAPRVH